MTLQSKRLWGFILVIAIGLLPAAGVLAATLQDSPAGQSKQIFLPVVANGSAANSAPLRVANHIIVKYSGDVHGQAIDEAFATYGATLVKAIPQIGAQVMELPADKVDAAIAGLSQQPGIAYVEPDYVAEGALTPNDQYYASYQYAPQIIQAPQAWDITMGSPNVIVAVLDSGADFSHPDLQGQLVAGHDYVNNDEDPSDDFGHGTHVAGIVAALTNNSTGVASIGAHSKVLVMKVLDSQGIGDYSNIAQAIIDATDHGVRIVNLSLGSTASSQALQDAVQYAWAHNVLLIAAAGNNGNSTPFYPAAYPEVMAVSMTNWVDSYVSLSNYGSWIAVAAPGYSIESTDWIGALGQYASRTGTSAAAPQVAGVAALVLSVNGNLTNQPDARYHSKFRRR